MIETSNPKIDVAELRAKVDAILAARGGAPETLPIPPLPRGLLQDIQHEIEQYLAEAERKSGVRRDLPPKLDRFPFRLLRFPIRWGLKVHGLAFRDQRAANAQLAGAVRVLADYAGSLRDHIETLRETVATQSAVLRAAELRLGELGDEAGIERAPAPDPTAPVQAKERP